MGHLTGIQTLDFNPFIDGKETWHIPSEDNPPVGERRPANQGIVILSAIADPGILGAIMLPWQ